LASLYAFPPSAQAAVSCNATHNPCAGLLYEGSHCIDGFCTNPFASDCLKALLTSDEYKEQYGGSASSQELRALRNCILCKPCVCNSQDDDKEQPSHQPSHKNCIPSEQDYQYQEVRIYEQNFEGTFILG
jgi:hypothetical protein